MTVLPHGPGETYGDEEHARALVRAGMAPCFSERARLRILEAVRALEASDLRNETEADE